MSSHQTLDLHLQKKVCQAFLKQLEDQSIDVQGPRVCKRWVSKRWTLTLQPLQLLWGQKKKHGKLSAPKSRDSLRLRRRFLPLPRKSRDFLRPQDARFPLRRQSLANRDFFCE